MCENKLFLNCLVRGKLETKIHYCTICKMLNEIPAFHSTLKNYNDAIEIARELNSKPILEIIFPNQSIALIVMPNGRVSTIFGKD